MNDELPKPKPRTEENEDTVTFKLPIPLLREFRAASEKCGVSYKEAARWSIEHFINRVKEAQP